MDACPPEIATDIEKIRDEVKHWTSSLKAPKEWGSGETVNLKTKFCQFMRFGPNDELLSETMEIGERLLQWSKDQELPFHAYKQHIGGTRRANLREEEENRDTARTHSPYRRAQEDYARVTQKRQRSRDEEYSKTAKRRECPTVKSMERDRRSSPRPDKRPSPRVERRPSPRVERRPSPRVERRPSTKVERRPSPRVERRPSPRTWKTAEDAGNFRTSKPCTFCGRKHPSDCKFKGHPDANTDPSIPWSESRVGRDEQGWLRELRFGLRATLGLGKKRARTFGKSRHGTHGNHRQTSLVVDSSSTMRADNATPTSGGEDSGTGYEAL